MKKLMIIIALLVMAAPSIVFAWSDSYGLMSPEDMKKAVCRNAIRLPFEVIVRYDDWAGRQTEVRPARVDLNPNRSYSEHIRVEAGTELAQMFPVGSSVTHLHEVYSVETAGPSTWTTAAGTSTFGGSTMIRYGGDWYVQSH